LIVFPIRPLRQAFQRFRCAAAIRWRPAFVFGPVEAPHGSGNAHLGHVLCADKDTQLWFSEMPAVCVPTPSV
jgi:hypothetical protein